ncbi:MAG: signal recognition particle-docking protein FtsY [Thermoproteota archaeon]|nr:signal recognition particle-docking protein FtsY [Thermoproteota archaeon]
MFDKLKRAFSNAAKSISQKELSAKDLDESLFDLNIALLESDVSQEVIDDLSSQIKNNLVGMKLQKNESTEQIISTTLKNNFLEILSKAGYVDLINRIQEKKQRKAGPFVIVFLGINGTGKTTTVAKVANLLKKNGFSVVIAAADTHRAGAIEQISSHAERLSIKVISQRYGADPSAVARDALEYAKKHYVDVVLIDTAGRMQTAKNLMDEIGKIVKVMKPDIKIFVGDSLSGNDTINQAKEFFSYTEFDGAILTKSDADAKGGAAISISYITAKPILYLGIGQSYDDLIPFDKMRFVDTIFSSGSLLDSHSRPISGENETDQKIPQKETIARLNSVRDIPADPIDEPLDISAANDIPDKSDLNPLSHKAPSPSSNIPNSLESDISAYKVDSHVTDSVDKAGDINTSNYYQTNDNNDIDNYVAESKQSPDDETKSHATASPSDITDDSKKKKGLLGWFKKRK